MKTSIRHTPTRVLQVAAGCLAAGVLAGCSGAVSASNAPSPVYTATSVPTPVYTATMTPTPVYTLKPASPGKTYTLTLKDSQGYSQKATLTLYPGQSGRNKSALQSEWAAVGGKGSDPCGDTSMTVGGGTGVKVVAETSYVVYGTLSIVNDSNGFAAQDMNWQWISNTGKGGWMSDPTPGVDTSMVVMGIGYGNGAVCHDTGSGGYIMSPNFGNGNKWGPVPVVFYVGGVYTPKHPEGNMTDITALTLSATSAFGSDIRDSSGAQVKGVALPTP